MRKYKRTFRCTFSKIITFLRTKTKTFLEQFTLLGVILLKHFENLIKVEMLNTVLKLRHKLLSMLLNIIIYKKAVSCYGLSGKFGILRSAEKTIVRKQKNTFFLRLEFLLLDFICPIHSQFFFKHKNQSFLNVIVNIFWSVY